MLTKNILYYDAYETYFDMVENNDIFSDYCNRVFGMDFSQDGFSDIRQVEDLIKAANIKNDGLILDIGCGNGKMIEYISDKTGAAAYGFDYSKNAINHAIKRTKSKAGKLVFSTGTIDEKEYPGNTFDAVLSVDTLYFTNNLTKLMEKIYSWLKPGGVFAAYYGEGHLKAKSADKDSTELAAALQKLKISYEAVDYTKPHFELMKRKRSIITSLKDTFEQNNMGWYYEASINQSIDTDMTFEEFTQKYNRFLYRVIKC